MDLKTPFIAPTITLVAFCGILFFQNYQMKQDAIDIAILKGSHNDLLKKSGRIEEELAANKHELQIVKSIISNLSNKINTFNRELPVIDKIDDMTHVDKNTADYQNLDELQEKNLLKTITKKLKIDKFEGSKRLPDPKFENEEVDHEWAYDYEQKILKMVELDQTYNFSLESVHCRTTACEVLLYSEPLDAMYTGVSFIKVIEQQNWRKKGAKQSFSPLLVDGSIRIKIER